MEEDTKTLDLIEKLVDKGLLADFQTSICTPLPGTPFYKWAKDNGYLLTEDWKTFNGGTAVVSYPGYSKEDIEGIFHRTSRIYLRSRIDQQGLIGLLQNYAKRYGLAHTIKKLPFHARTVASIKLRGK
ncbi:hypothetical protein ES703_63313 [subsurface metagenome]